MYSNGPQRNYRVKCDNKWGMGRKKKGKKAHAMQFNEARMEEGL